MLLNGTWKLTGADAAGNPLCLDGTVPGCVHTDLIAAGLLPDLFWRDNSKTCQWIENQDFTYSKTIFVENPEPNAWLEFDGLDTYCDVYLNGQQIGSGDDMFISYEFPVDGVLRHGENLLEVRFKSPIAMVAGKPLRSGAFTRERMHTRRIQCTYSWDWVDRFVTMGIYRDVRLTFRKANEPDQVYLFTKNINPYSAQMQLELTFWDFLQQGDQISFEIRNPEGDVCFRKQRTILQPNMLEYIDIRDPQLWYPAGYGQQPLYTLKISTATSEKTLRFGIRQITILQLEDEPGSEEAALCAKLKAIPHLADRDRNDSTACFTVLVNGVRIMCKGGNWVPCDPFPSAESPEKIRKLLELAVDGGVNMLRVWGGGIFEREEFYEECDRLGILVTQDFLMACGNYPEEEAWFIEALKKEAEYAALRLRNHACLAWWSGDNENATQGDENITDFTGYRSATFGIGPVISKLDPQRYFLASSPFGGKPYSSFTRGTTHGTYFLGTFFQYVRESDFKDYRSYFSTYLSRFNAEQPAMGMPFVSSMRKFLTDEDIFGDDTSMSEFHTKNNPGLGEVTLYSYVELLAQKIFGDFTSGEDRVRKMQMLQCEWIRLTLELYRRNKWFSSGILYWMYNDCWPAANGWSLVDYYAMPKPAFYAFKRCAKPVIASLEQEGEELRVYVCNDSLEAASGNGKVYLYDFRENRELMATSFDYAVGANIAQHVLTVDYREMKEHMTNSTVILCDIPGDRAFLIPGRYQDLDLHYVDAKILEQSEETVTVTTDSFLPFAMVDLPAVLDDNCMPLKKGEIRTLKFKS